MEPLKKYSSNFIASKAKQSHGAATILSWPPSGLLKGFVFVFLLNFLASCSGSIVAEVDGSKIFTPDVVKAIEIEKSKFDPVIIKTGKNKDAFKRSLLENLIQEQILLNEAKRQGIKISKADIDIAMKNFPDSELFKNRNINPDVWRERQEKRLIIKKLVDKEVIEKIPVSPDDVSSYYKSHQKDFSQPSQYHARQIVVDSKELADEILKKLRRGEDFAELAQEYSLSPDRKRGGDLGFFNANTFPSVFAQICSRLKPGEISDVVATDYGFQIFQLLEKRPPRQISLEEAVPEIERSLREKKREQAFEEWFKNLRSKAHVAIKQEVLEKIDVD
jgi:peptidyl-prolyl cis-trans isomerase C/foldase protein PrsA